MSTTYEGIVEGGQVKLDPSVRIPDRTKVLVTVPDPGSVRTVRIWGPRLANPADAKRFKKRVRKLDENADLRKPGI